MTAIDGNDWAAGAGWTRHRRIAPATVHGPGGEGG
jgi:hypothetical protein